MPNFSGIWSAAQQFQARGQTIWPSRPGAPTIGTVTVSGTTASVPFTASTDKCYVGGATSFTATSTPGCITGTGASSPISVSGLTGGTSYTFKVRATNLLGNSACSAASNSVTPAVTGQQAYTSPGSYTWVAPTGVSKVSVVAVGGGKAGGGGLGYKNNYSVTPGGSYTVVVGTGACARTGGCAGDSYFVSTAVVKGGKGTLSCGGTYTGDGGGNGGSRSTASCSGLRTGGGGAGGYAGNGGNGGNANTSGSAGAGGGGGGAAGWCAAFGNGSGSGGGVGILGQGANGSGGPSGSSLVGGGGGSGGGSGTRGAGCGCGQWFGQNGGAYGGGGSSGNGFPSGSGATGAVRIIWPGCARSFPSTCTGNL